jgi:polyhydroxyalkanoate synthesis repressor PhaR
MTRRTSPPEAVLIKKYANRRLYNTQISNYVTLQDLCDMVKKNEEFIVKDAKTDEDLTQQILTQIIFEQETKGHNLLPINFLRQLICFYDDNLRNMVPSYLEQMMGLFTQHQDQMRQHFKQTIPDLKGMPNPMIWLEEMTKQQQAMWTQMTQLWDPFQLNKQQSSTKPTSEKSSSINEEYIQPKTHSPSATKPAPDSK